MITPIYGDIRGKFLITCGGCGLQEVLSTRISHRSAEAEARLEGWRKNRSDRSQGWMCPHCQRAEIKPPGMGPVVEI